MLISNPVLPSSTFGTMAPFMWHVQGAESQGGLRSRIILGRQGTSAYLQRVRPFVSQIPHEDDCVNPVHILCLDQELLQLLNAAVHVPDDDDSPFWLQLALEQLCMHLGRQQLASALQGE